MNPFTCDKELFVLEALRSGCWDADLRRHAVNCAVCADAVLAAEFLRELHGADLAGANVPHAGRVWWKAQLRARREAAERAARPIALAQMAALVCSALALVGVCVWQWNTIYTWLSSIAGKWRVSPASLENLVANLWGNSTSTLIMGATAVVVFLTFVAYLVWKEE